MPYTFGTAAFDGFAAAVTGSTAASGTLTLNSTSHATKGLIKFGTASAYDEANDRLGIGTQAPDYGFHLKRNVGAGSVQSRFVVENVSSTGEAMWELAANPGSADLAARAYGSSHAGTLFGMAMAGHCAVFTGVGALAVGTAVATPTYLCSNNAVRVTCESTGSVVVGLAALATSATDGFLYIPSCAGTPTGVPTAKTGRTALIYDTTANKWWAYNGAWRGVALA